LRPLAFATFLVWRLRIGACGVGACGLGAYDSYPKDAHVHFFFRLMRVISHWWQESPPPPNEHYQIKR